MGEYVTLSRIRTYYEVGDGGETLMVDFPASPAEPRKK